MWWESEFLKPWISEYKTQKERTFAAQALKTANRFILQGKQIRVGTGIHYYASWHTNIPGPLPLTYNSQMARLGFNPTGKTNGKNTKILFTPGRGLYAGFVSISRRKDEEVKDLWFYSVQFVLDRYFMGSSRKYGERVISDTYCKQYSGHTIGKDERILLFAFSATENLLKKTEYYYIEYSPPIGQRASKEIAGPSWPISGSGKRIIFESLLTPYYNREVYNTIVPTFGNSNTIKTINDSIYETQAAIIHDYWKFKKSAKYDEKLRTIAQSIATCNPFLNEAGIVPLEEIEGEFRQQSKQYAATLRNRKTQREIANEQARSKYAAMYTPERSHLSGLLGGTRTRTRSARPAARRTRKALVFLTQRS
jgi:hypothetical protein